MKTSLLKCYVVSCMVFMTLGCSFSPQVTGFHKGHKIDVNESLSPTVNSSSPSESSSDATAKSEDDPLLAIHTPKPASCINCHEAKRPTPTHYAKQDCVSCHSYPSFKNAAFSHNPTPTTCEGCHARPTTVGLRAYPNQGPPAAFDPNNPAEPGSGHYRGKDCVNCHATPSETVTKFAFTHSKPGPMACLPCHFNDGLNEHGANGRGDLTAFGNCFNCHQNFDKSVSRNWRRP